MLLRCVDIKMQGGLHHSPHMAHARNCAVETMPGVQSSLSHSGYNPHAMASMACMGLGMEGAFGHTAGIMLLVPFP